MDKKMCKKLKQLIKDGRPAKLKSYIRKHDIDIQHLQFSNGKTLLHYCCKYHDFNGYRFFTKEGVDVSIKDDCGNTALHIALKQALKTRESSEVNSFYSLIILPTLEQHPESLKWRNHEDVTCRDLLDQLKEKYEEAQCEDSHEDWEDKLADEIDHEYQEEWGTFSGGVSKEEDFTESYDDWSERMNYEYNRKRKHSTSLPRSSKKTKTKEEDFNSKLKKEREKMRKKYEENQKRAQQNYKKHKKDVYEKKWQTLSENIEIKQLPFSEIPWPFKDSVSELEDFLFHDLTKNDTRKKYLRDQMKRWHPDKFLQKFGKHILSTEREHVLQRVKQISQELNQLLEKFK